MSAQRLVVSIVHNVMPSPARASHRDRHDRFAAHVVVVEHVRRRTLAIDQAAATPAEASEAQRARSSLGIGAVADEHAVHRHDHAERQHRRLAARHQLVLLEEHHAQHHRQACVRRKVERDHKARPPAAERVVHGPQRAAAADGDAEQRAHGEGPRRVLASARIGAQARPRPHGLTQALCKQEGQRAADGGGAQPAQRRRKAARRVLVWRRLGVSIALAPLLCGRRRLLGQHRAARRRR
mmetsp:Transcript_17114/g.60048  ORF Transcript_17114/g.60048 Transcript_17114/m.60048 type:complete len:239 (+) Transcript_17114:1082-1798(+)